MDGKQLSEREMADAERALERLRELGAGESLEDVVERFARRRAAAVAKARAAGKPPAGEPAFLFPNRVKELLREFERRHGDEDAAVGVQLALGFFAGLTGTETALVEWHDIDETNATLCVRRRLPGGRTALDRTVDLEPNAVAWLEKERSWFSWHNGNRTPEGPVVRSGPGFANWVRVATMLWEGNWDEATFRAVMRSTFAAMHLAAFGDADATARALGHREAGEAIALHYGGLVTPGIAEEFWGVVPWRAKPRPVAADLREEMRSAARKAWDEAWRAEEKRERAETADFLSAKTVRAIFRAVEKHPGTLESAPGAALALGFFAGARNEEIRRARWEDFDPEKRTMLLRQTPPATGSSRVGADLRVTLSESAALWLLRWRTWATPPGGAPPTGPIVPIYGRFNTWVRRILVRQGVVGSFPRDVMARTFRAMRFADVDDPNPGEPDRPSPDAESADYWSILPPRRVRPALAKSRPRRVLPSRADRKERSRSEQPNRTKPLPSATVRRIFACVADKPGPLEAGIGPYLTLGFLAGLHTEEIHRTTWEDVDWTEGCVRIPRPDGHRDEAANAVVPLSPAALAWMRRWRDWAGGPEGVPPTGLVVPHYWRFMHWRCAERRLARVRWDKDVMRVTFEARKGEAAYARIRPPDAVIPPPAPLPGRGCRTDLRERFPGYEGPLDPRKHNPQWRIVPAATVERAFRLAEAQPGDARTAAGAVLTLGFLVGLRTSEIARARWEDVRWDEAAMVVPKPRVYAKSVPVPKTLPLRPNALAWLRRWAGWAAPPGGWGPSGPSGPVAPSPWRFLEWKKKALAPDGADWGEHGQHDIMRLTCETMARAAGLPDAPPQNPEDRRPATSLAPPEDARAFWSFLPSDKPYPPPVPLKWNPRGRRWTT